MVHYRSVLFVRLDSNGGPLVSEATTLPTEPQPPLKTPLKLLETLILLKLKSLV